MTEHLIQEQRGPIPAVILRLAGVYDDVCRSAFLAHQIAAIYERKFESYVYPGNVATGQSALHLDDLTDALRLVIDRRKELPPYSVILLGEPEALSFDEIQRTVGKLIRNQEWKTRQIPKPLARTGAWVEDEILQEDSFIRPWMVDNADAHYQLDISRARISGAYRQRVRSRTVGGTQAGQYPDRVGFDGIFAQRRKSDASTTNPAP
jgi:nucleoside-diphosphate-sugar epimerase